MIAGLEPLSCAERLSELEVFSLEKAPQTPHRGLLVCNGAYEKDVERLHGGL